MLLEVASSFGWFNPRSLSFRPSNSLSAVFFRLIIVSQVSSHVVKKKKTSFLKRVPKRSQKNYLKDPNQLNQKAFLQIVYEIFTIFY
jgi:hypothetical protein